MRIDFGNPSPAAPRHPRARRGQRRFGSSGGPVRRAWLLAALTLGCGEVGERGALVGDPEVSEPTATDAGAPLDDGSFESDIGIRHELTELTVDGQVKVGALRGAGNSVRVVARCGDSRVESLTDDTGRYQITSNVEGCNQLIVEFHKEAFLPISRVVHLPPPTSPVTIDVLLAELLQLICGEGICQTENDPRIQLSPDPIQRGFIRGFSGHSQIHFLAGEPYDTEGRVLWVPAFTYADLRDGDGNQLREIDGPDWCQNIARESLDELGDAVPGNDAVEVPLHRLDEATGRWRRYGMSELFVEADGGLAKVSEPFLGNVRAGLATGRVWLCGPMLGSGWLVAGLPIQGNSCVHVTVSDQCGRPIPNTVVTAEGRDYSFRSVTWSDRDGAACLDVARSEVASEDINGNQDGGETVFMDIELRGPVGTVRFPAQELPREEGSCDQPETCVAIHHDDFDFARGDCPEEDEESE